MPDGRFLAKSVAHDLELNAVSLRSDYLFTRCIPHLDCEGRMFGHPSQVKAIAVPLRKEFTTAAIERALTELTDAALVVWYEVDGRKYLEFPGFTGNQKGLRLDREAASKIPHSGPTPEDSGLSPRSSEVAPPKLSKGKVSKDVATEFEELWAIHRRGSKQDALEGYGKAVKNGVGHPTMLAALKAYVRNDLRPDFKGEHLFRWIKNKRWEEHEGRRRDTSSNAGLRRSVV